MSPQEASMAKAMFYRQCKIERKEGESTIQLVTWLPESGDGVDLEPGVTLRIEDPNDKGVSEERWTVASVGQERQPEKRVKKRAHDWKNYMSNTDI